MAGVMQGLVSMLFEVKIGAIESLFQALATHPGRPGVCIIAGRSRPVRA